MIPYRISSAARDDLDSIWRYVAHDSLDAADRLIDLFHEKFLLLSSQPGLGESRNELSAGLRIFTVGKYAVFYRPTQSNIEIVRLIHASRDMAVMNFPEA